MTNFATTSIMPFLARLVIAAAMLTSGWVNCFSQVQIQPRVVEGLQSMDIETHEPLAKEADQTTLVEGAQSPLETETPVISRNPTTRGVNRIVWLVHEQWPTLGSWGTLIAWTAAVAQLVAGVLLLVGLFTRFAALAICVATGMAVFLVSVNLHGMFSMNPFDWPLDSHRFIQLFAGLGLFTLSLGLFLGGGGSFSLDSRYSRPQPEPKTKAAKNSSQ